MTIQAVALNKTVISKLNVRKVKPEIEALPTDIQARGGFCLLRAFRFFPILSKNPEKGARLCLASRRCSGCGAGDDEFLDSRLLFDSRQAFRPVPKNETHASQRSCTKGPFRQL